MTREENKKASDSPVLPADSPLLSIDRLTVQSGGMPLIEELEIDVASGSSVAIIDSGRGSKVALLDAISGLRPAFSGSVRLAYQ